MGIEVRPATLGDLREFYERDKIDPSTNALIWLLNGKPIAVGGLVYEHGVVGVFLSLKDEARSFKHHIHRHARRFVQDALKRHKYIFARQEEDEPTAPKWLARLGFKNIGGNLWRASK